MSDQRSDHVQPGCERVEEQLPLLAYPDELSPAERQAVLAHLHGCAGCSALRAELEEAVAGLDQVPLARPDPARWAGLKASVLAAVAAPALSPEAQGPDAQGPDAQGPDAQGPDAQGCPQEVELLARETLSPGQLSALDAHLAGCDSCRTAERELALVGRALDRWSAPIPAALAGMREQVLTQVGAAASPVAPAPAVSAPAAPARGLLLRLRPLLSAASLAAAILLGVWLGFAPADARAALVEADRLALEGQLDPARERYRALLQDPQVSAMARTALETIEWLEAARKIPDAAARRKRLAELIVRHPDVAVATPAIQALTAEMTSTASGSRPFSEPLRYDEMGVSEELRTTLTQRSFELAQRFQRALRAEVQGDVITARALYRELIELDPESLAAQRAQERLSRLG